MFRLGWIFVDWWKIWRPTRWRKIGLKLFESLSLEEARGTLADAGGMLISLHCVRVSASRYENSGIFPLIRIHVYFTLSNLWGAGREGGGRRRRGPCSCKPETANPITPGRASGRLRRFEFWRGRHPRSACKIHSVPTCGIRSDAAASLAYGCTYAKVAIA